MDLPAPADRDAVLAQPTRARLFALLGELRRPAGIDELAAATGLHPNGVRTHLHKLHAAGLLDKTLASRGRGRPREEFAVSPDARPGGRAPVAYGDLARWLGRAVGDGRTGLRGIERRGREIGRELAPQPAGEHPVRTLTTALAALGFAPAVRVDGPGRVTFELGNCPYREAVAENQPLICTLHRGLSQGLLDGVAPGASLRDFVARDPYAAGCLIRVSGLPGDREPS